MVLNTKRLNKLLDRFSSLKVAVLGVLVADLYWTGRLSRFSREAPVPIVSLEKETLLPGGAANTATNILSLSGRVNLFGRLGSDKEGTELSSLLREKKGLSLHLFESSDYRTITKLRIKAGGFHTRYAQVLRLDRELPEIPLTDKDIETLIDNLSIYDALILSDYGYGSASPSVFERLKKRIRKGMVFAVDSRHRIALYKGASLITPNEEETAYTFGKEAIEEDKILEYARQLRKMSEAKNLIVTRGHAGMALVEKGRKGFLLPICGGTDIVDTTGAGDTVIAAATLALASGGNLMDAGIIATCAASITIMQEGAASASIDELRKEIEAFQNQVYGR